MKTITIRFTFALIQTSPDLQQWTDWTKVNGPFWTTLLLDPLLTNYNRSFYRIRQ